ncbi:MAG: hypothetical protein Greene041679_428, partial [Parcubacteria group bacterium Greene0416_79]
DKPDKKRRQTNYKQSDGGLKPHRRGRSAVPDEEEHQCGAGEKTGEEYGQRKSVHLIGHTSYNTKQRRALQKQTSTWTSDVQVDVQNFPSVVPADGVAPSFRVYESLVLLLNYTGVYSIYYINLLLTKSLVRCKCFFLKASRAGVANSLRGGAN